MKVEAVDDSIYHWNVQLDAHGFVGLGEGGKQLAADLAQASRCVGCVWTQVCVACVCWSKFGCGAHTLALTLILTLLVVLTLTLTCKLSSSPFLHTLTSHSHTPLPGGDDLGLQLCRARDFVYD